MMKFYFNMAFVTALCFLLLALPLRTIGFNHSVGPLAFCSKESSVDLYADISSCYLMCKSETFPTDFGYITLYQDFTTDGGPKVKTCRKYKLESVYTQTWTFTTLPPVTTIEQVPATYDECMSVIHGRCPNDTCTIKIPQHTREEYHYASDTLIQETHLEVMTHPSAVDYYKGIYRVSPAHSSESYPMDLGKFNDGGVIHIWNSSYMPLGSCPFKRSARFECDAFDKPSRHYVCGTGRFSITPSESDDSQGKTVEDCKMHRSKEGLLYDFYSKNDSQYVSRSDKRIKIPLAVDLAVVQTSASDHLAQAIINLDSDVCHNQCELAALELRMERHKETLVRYGNKYGLSSGYGTGHPCCPLHGCRLSTPHSYCSNPHRIGVKCAGRQYYWNPMKPYISDYQPCDSPLKSDGLKITVGTKEYRVGDDLTIEYNLTELHPLPHDFLASSGSDSFADVGDIHLIMKSWSAYKNETTLKSEAGSYNATIQNDMWWGVPTFFVIAASKIEELFSMFPIIMTIIAGCFAIWVALTIFKLFNERLSTGSDRKREEEANSVRYSSVWQTSY